MQPRTAHDASGVSPAGACAHAVYLTTVLVGLGCCAVAQVARAQEPTSAGAPPRTTQVRERVSQVAAQVDVNPIARDEEIRGRLQRVLEATEWFAQPKVRVQEGVVFLSGDAESDALRKWAGDLARNTQDVVAVVNRMTVPEPSPWDVRPAWRSLWSLWRGFIRSMPLVLFALVILALALGGGVLTTRGARALLRPRIRARLLRTVVAGAAGALVFLIGTYVILRIFGLTQLALTLVGGTGLLGLAVGIAFREITENFLASVFLSVQHPFETTDLVEVAGVTGYVRQLNMRTTILMTLDGSLVQIPNAMVYKSTLRNFTANCNRREDFVIGIGYDDSIDAAQEVARDVLAGHPAVLSDPAPLVLADSLGASTVNLRVYFWLNGREHSWLKVRSSVIRLVKRGYQQHGISMPDEAREVVFPHGVPVTMSDPGPVRDSAQVERPRRVAPAEVPDAVTASEGGLSTEAAALDEQARKAQPLREEDNLLAASPLERDHARNEPG